MRKTGMKNKIFGVLIIAFGLFLLLPPPVLACHIVNVDAVYDCDGYEVTIWAWVHEGYKLRVKLELSNDSGYHKNFYRKKVFTGSGQNVKTVFTGSWGDTLCGD